MINLARLIPLDTLFGGRLLCDRRISCFRPMPVDFLPCAELCIAFRGMKTEAQVEGGTVLAAHIREHAVKASVPHIRTEHVRITFWQRKTKVPPLFRIPSCARTAKSFLMETAHCLARVRTHFTEDQLRGLRLALRRIDALPCMATVMMTMPNPSCNASSK